MESNPVHFAWSRDLYQSAAVTFTVYEAKQFGGKAKTIVGGGGRLRMAGKASEPLISYFDLCTGHRPYRGTLKSAVSY